MGLLAALPIHGRHHHKVDCDLMPNGIKEICTYLERCGIQFVPPKTWKWDLDIVAKGIYTGTLTKRIAKWCHKHGKPLNDFQKTQIGNLAKRLSHPKPDYHFDFDNELAWESGDFGDEPSCFFNYETKIRAALRECGWMAARFYRDEECTEGCGRILLLPQGRYLIAMNGYWTNEGEYCEYTTATTERLAGVLAAWLDKPIKEVALVRRIDSSYPYYHSRIYANSNMGFAIGTTNHRRFTLDDKPGVKLEAVA